jgi:PAS domain S-box-containing protein
MRGILGPGPGPIRVRVHDGPEAGEENLLWDSAPDSREPERVSYSAPIEVNGRTWTARFTAGDVYVGALGLRSSGVDAAAMALGVVLITALTGGLVASTRGRRREAALAGSLGESEARYRAIFERAPVGIFVVAPDDRYVRVNPRYCEITGRTEEELLRMRWHDVVHPDDRDRDAVPIRELREGRRAWVSLERRGVRKDGSTFWATTTFSLESGGTPADAPLVGVMEEVTTRHEAEARFRDIAERAVAGILIIQDDRIVYANPATAEILEKPPQEILTSGDALISAVVHPDDAARVRMDRERQLREPESMVPFLAYRVLRPDGTVRLVERTARSIQHGGRPATLMTLTDVTDRERTAAEMQKAQRLESLGVLAGGIAHDFNNLLTAVFGGIEEARSLAGAGSEVARELDDAVAALARARDLTRQLLTFAAGGAPERRLVDLRRSLEAAAQLALGGSQVRARLEVPATLPDVEADEGQLSQLWSNLLLNARQATAGAGDVTIRARLRRGGEVHVEGLEVGSYVEVQIADAGHGIPPEVLPRVFDPFYTTRETGTGLGLSVCYSIVRRHGGHLGITSRVGDGTVVTVLLPAADGKSATAPPPAPSPLPGRLHVLLMDDEPLVRKVGEKHLRKLGLEVTAVANGEEAVEAWRRAREAGSPFDVALLDLTVVGGMGGAEAAKAIRRLDPGAVTVACSGYFEDAVMAEPERYGFDGVLAKPYLTDDLQAVLARVGGRTRPAGAAR